MTYSKTRPVIAAAIARLRAAGFIQSYSWYSVHLVQEMDTLISGSYQPPTTYNVFTHQYGTTDDTNNIMLYTDTVMDKTGMRVMKGDILYTKVSDYSFFLGTKTQLEPFILPGSLSVTRASDSITFTLNEDYKYEPMTGIIEIITPSVGNGDITDTLLNDLYTSATYSNIEISSDLLVLTDDTLVGTFLTPLIFLPPNCLWDTITVTASITDCTCSLSIYENARSGTPISLGSLVDGINTYDLSSYSDTRALSILINIGVPTPVTGSVFINISTGTGDLEFNTIGARCLASFTKERMIVDNVNEFSGYIKCHREVMR